MSVGDEPLELINAILEVLADSFGFFVRKIYLGSSFIKTCY